MLPQTNQGGLWWGLSTVEKCHLGAVEEGCLLSPIFFYIAWTAVYMSFTWGSEAPRCQQAGRGSVILWALFCWKPWIQPFMWTYLKLLQTRYTLSWQCQSLMEVGSFSRILHPAALHKLFRNGLRKKSSRWWPGLPIQLSICGVFDPRLPHLTTYTTWKICC